MRHVVVAAMLCRGRSVLLCHRSPGRLWYPDVWDLPGGHVEPGEHPGQRPARELSEELGVLFGELAEGAGPGGAGQAGFAGGDGGRGNGPTPAGQKAGRGPEVKINSRIGCLEGG